MDAQQILVVDDNRTSTKMMDILLRKEGYTVVVKNDPLEALQWLRNPVHRPDLLISDLNMPGMSGHELVKQIKKDPSLKYLPIIMLTAQHDMAQKFAGFEAGVDDYLTKPVSSTELLLRIRALLARTKAAGDVSQQIEGKVFTVFSLRGGVGRSTIAVNLATALAMMWQIKVPLVDLSLQNGHCALMLNTKPRNTIVQLAETITDEIDIDLIERVLQSHETQVALLPAPMTAAEAELIPPQVVQQVLPYLRVEYPFTVVDTGAVLDDIVLSAFDHSTHILMVVTPELGSLKAATDALKIMEQLDYPLDTVHLVLNNIFPHGGISPEEIEAALGKKIIATIPASGSTTAQAINTGKPVVFAHPEHAITREVVKMAYNFSPDDLKNNLPDPLPPLLQQFAVNPNTQKRSRK